MRTNYRHHDGPSSAAAAVQRAEECVIGCLVNHGGEELPPSLLRILEHSPDSFDDKRYGTIARVVWRLRRDGREVNPVTVRKELMDADDPELGALALQLLDADMPVACAEDDAGRLWPAYQHRRLTGLLTEAADAATRHPDAASDILARLPGELIAISDAASGGTRTTGQPALSEPSPFPMESLPTAAREMAEAIAAAEGTPPTLAGVCVLGILSAAIGRGLQVQSGADRVSRGNLYIVGSAESGSGKSETYRHAARPFNEYEHHLVEHWRQNVQHQIGSEVTMLEKELARLEKSAGSDNQSAIEREELRQRIEAKQARLAQVSADNHAPCLQCEDVTTEKLAAMLAANGEQLASLSSDAGTIVSNLLGRYNSTGRTDESIYLKAWSGDGFRVDRLGREPVSLTSPCLSALWLVQRDKVNSLLEVQSLSDGGLIPRLLVCDTKAEAQRIEGARPGIPPTTAAAWAELINTLLDTYHQAKEPQTIQPADDALAALVGYHNAIVDRRKADLSDVGSFAARWAEQAWRIAVCLHAARHGASAGERQLAVETALAAIRLAGWFSEQQLAILGGVREAGKRKVRDEVLALLADTPTGITARDIQRGRIVTTADEARALLATMETEGTLASTPSKPDGGGHVTLTYRLARN